METARGKGRGCLNRVVRKVSLVRLKKPAVESFAQGQYLSCPGNWPFQRPLFKKMGWFNYIPTDHLYHSIKDMTTGGHANLDCCRHLISLALPRGASLAQFLSLYWINGVMPALRVVIQKAVICLLFLFPSFILLLRLKTWEGMLGNTVFMKHSWENPLWP